MKLVITADTFAPSVDGPVPLAANTLVDQLAPDTAHAIVRAGKGLYVDKKDDPTRGNGYTASAEYVRLVVDAAKAADKAEAKG